MNFDQGFLNTRRAGARGVVGQLADDQGIAIRLKKLGTGTVTSVTVTAATNIVMITSDGGTDTYAFETYATVGALVDAINADGIFEAKVLDALRSSATASAFIDGAITISSDGYYDVKSDTSEADFLAYRLSYNREVPAQDIIAKNHRVHIQEIVTNVTLGGGADANGIRIYECNPDSKSETIIWQSTPTTGSAATINWASGNAVITAKEGNDLVVVVIDATSVTGTLTVVGTIE